jgi:hypothetical protein
MGAEIRASQFIFLLIILPLALTFIAPTNSCRSDSNQAAPAQPGNHENQSGSTVAGGIWGGDHIQLEVNGEGATVEFDCAHGTVSGPLRLDRDGRFQATGTFIREHGGPVRNDETPASYPANYSGSINGKTMTIKVVLKESAAEVGTFTLQQDRDARLTKCR